MDQTCEIVRDLLPLYLDDACSAASKEYVARHLADCPACAALLRELRDQTVEDSLSEERREALSHQAKRFRSGAVLAGCVLSGILMIPVLVCLIVNLASGHALTWFFLVLASLLVFASLTVVPLLVPENRFLWTMGTFTGSLLLLLLVCCLYAGGNWFFVAASSVLFGLGVCFLPFIVRCRPCAALLGRKKALTVFTLDTFLFLMMMVSIGFRVGHPGTYSRIALASALPPIAYAWILFLIIRYVPANGLVRAGLCCAVTGSFLFFVPGLVGALLHSPVPFPVFSLMTWNGGTLNDNILWLCLIGGAVLCVLFCLLGLCGKRRK